MRWGYVSALSTMSISEHEHQDQSSGVPLSGHVIFIEQEHDKTYR